MTPAEAKPRFRVPAGSISTPAMPSRSAPSSQFMRGERVPTFQGWHPALREISDDVKAAWRLGTARAVDSIQNSGWLAGAVDKSMAAVCGVGLRLNAKPDMQAFGWNEEQTSEWARKVERRYEAWANSPRACDAGGRYTLAQLGAQAYRHWLATGEIVATLPYFAHPGSEFQTKIKLLPAWRLADRSDFQQNIFQGVRLNAVGAPSGYLFKIRTPFMETGEVELIASDAYGRPVVMHIFDGEPEQYRGITNFVPILKVMRQFDQLADATLTAATIQAIFAATFKSSASPEDVLDSLRTEGEQQGKDFERLLTEKAGWYEKTDINLGTNGKIAHLFPGDSLEFLRSEHPNSTYEAFGKFLLREGTTVCALTTEDFSGDYSGATYSSIRMSGSLNWPRVMYRRKHVAGRFMQIGYEAWLEEDIEKGRTPLPGGVVAFLKNKDSICRADWRGPPKPQADDLKTAKAHETWKALGVLTDESICSDNGDDLDDVYEQLAREMKRRQQLGLPEWKGSSNTVADRLVTEPGDKANDGTGKSDQSGDE
jgi:lambda family phage portal protein